MTIHEPPLEAAEGLRTRQESDRLAGARSWLERALRRPLAHLYGDAQVRAAIQANYAGGWDQFAADFDAGCEQ